MATLALPPRLWLPDAPLDPHMQSLGLTPAGKGLALGGSLWAPFSAGGTVLGSAIGGPASSSSTPRALMSVTASEGTRVRRRALWRGEAGLPDQPVLVEWFPAAQLPTERLAAERVRGLCHAQLLRLLAIGAADARSGYAVSEASDGVDLATVSRAAPGDLPAWWTVHVIAQLCRAVHFLVDAQGRHGRVCRGHGRISSSTAFVGWNGSVQLLAFAAHAGPLRSEETIAPELRASDRFLTPAADVYALAVLLRQLLPAQVAARPVVGRLLRRALHTQADQRMALSTFANSLQSLLFDLQAPLARARALGDVLGRYCPRASSDLLETDWGESTGDGLAALPPSLAPLAAAPVSLSPTWYQRPAAPKGTVDRPARPRARLVVGTLLGVAVSAGLWLGLQASEPGSQTTPEDLPKLVSAAVAGSPLARDSMAKAPSRPPPEAHVEPALRLADAEGFGALRVDLAPVRHGTRRTRSESVQRVWIQLSNTGPVAQTINLQQLRLRSAQGVWLRPLTVSDAPGPAWVTVGAGRRVSRMLAFGPDVSDTAPASPPAASAAQQNPLPPNANSSR